jgi:hypothetical protein
MERGDANGLGRALQHFGFRVLAARTIENENLGKSSEARDGVDELHRLPAMGGMRAARVGHCYGQIRASGVDLD